MADQATGADEAHLPEPLPELLPPPRGDEPEFELESHPGKGPEVILQTPESVNDFRKSLGYAAVPP